MDPNIKLPDWLTKEKIQEYREDLKTAEPYTDKEVADLPFDGLEFWNMDKYRAYVAKDTLTKYGLL